MLLLIKNENKLTKDIQKDLTKEKAVRKGGQVLLWLIGFQLCSVILLLPACDSFDTKYVAENECLI